MESSTVRQEIERRIHEKEEEFENTRRNHQRALESMQASLEGEVRAKGEALKQVRSIRHFIETNLLLLEKETRIGHQ